MPTVIDRLREAVMKSEVSRYRIAIETGISESQLSRLVSGERGLSIDTAERLAEYLGFEIVIRPKRRKG